VNASKEARKNVIAVGTTSMRAIESSVSTDGYLKSYEGWTNKFIFPPYDFRVANALVTNFHMPMSTLMIMVSAFAGHDFLMEAYREAVKEEYRFFTYGDAMLII
jgi:S-adenosylmethionine:tRNA ribosyltransferase-isomerase